VPVIEALLAAGAKIEEADYPTGSERVDEVLRRHGEMIVGTFLNSQITLVTRDLVKP